MHSRFNKIILPLIIVLISAFWIRIIGINFGLPYLYHPDEPSNLENIISTVKNEKPNIFFFDYPAGFFNIQANFYRLFFIFNPFPKIELLVPSNGYINHPEALLFGRVINVFFSVGTVILIFFTLLEVTRSLKVSILTSLLAAFSSISIEHSRWLRPDALTGFFTMAALFLSLKIIRAQKLKFYVLAGLFSGLAASTKYNALFVFVVVLSAHFLTLGFRGLYDKRIYLSFLFLITGFLLGSPQMLFETNNYLTGFLYDLSHYTTGHAGAEGNSMLFYFTTLLKRETSGLMLFIVAVLTLFKVRQKALLVTCSFVFPFLIFISNYEVHFNRNLIPMLGPLFVSAGIGVNILYNLPLTKLKTILVTLAVSILILVSLSRSFSEGIVLTKDSRADARNWIDMNIPVGSRIAVEGYGPWINLKKFKVYGVGALSEFTIDDLNLLRIKYVVAAEENYERFLDNPEKYPKEVMLYDKIFGSFEEIAKFNEDEYQIRIFKIR